MSEQMYIHMGPQHPVNHGLWTLKVRTEGEKIIDSEIKIGYIFRMIEKMAESRPYDTFQPLADRLCYVSAMSWEGTYIMAIEKLLEFEVSKKVQYMRVILLELQRIASHFTWLSAYAGDLGVLTMLVIPYREREYVLDILEHVTGSRMMYNYFRPGGLKHDFPNGFSEDARNLTYYLDDKIHEYRDMLDDSKVFMMRSKDVGNLSQSMAFDLGTTGPVLRASGVPGDLRKIEPYLVYDELDFNIPVQTKGDCYARFQIRMQEILQSTHIIRQALDQMPKEGEIQKKVPRKLPKGEVYFRAEDPRGEAGFYIIGNEDRIPYRVKIRSPAYNNLYASAYLLKGAKVADIPPIVASMDLCMGEIDR